MLDNQKRTRFEELCEGALFGPRLGQNFLKPAHQGLYALDKFGQFESPFLETVVISAQPFGGRLRQAAFTSSSFVTKAASSVFSTALSWQPDSTPVDRRRGRPDDDKTKSSWPKHDLDDCRDGLIDDCSST